MNKQLLVFLGSEHNDFMNEYQTHSSDITFIINSSFNETVPAITSQNNTLDFGLLTSQNNFPVLSKSQYQVLSELLQSQILSDKSCMFAWERQIGLINSLSAFRNMQGFHTLLYASHIIKYLTENHADTLLFFYTPHNLFSIVLARISAFLDIKTLIMRPTILPYVSWVSRLQIISEQPHEQSYQASPSLFTTQGDYIELVDSSIALLNSSKPTKRELTVRKLKYKPSFSPQNIFKRLYISQFSQFFTPSLSHDITRAMYVVFYLHFQPESTTSPDAGNHFYDMLSVIGLLRSQLPADYKLLVKEHPATFKPNVFNHLWRCRRFYSYISDLPNTQLIHPQIPNSHLFANASAICSVSGTVISEALCRGIKSIGFTHLNLLPAFLVKVTF